MLANLTGRTFYSTEVVGHDLVEGSRITVSFPTAARCPPTPAATRCRDHGRPPARSWWCRPWP